MTTLGKKYYTSHNRRKAISSIVFTATILLSSHATMQSGKLSLQLMRMEMDFPTALNSSLIHNLKIGIQTMMDCQTAGNGSMV